MAPPEFKPICDPNIEGDCQTKLAKLFEQLRELEPDKEWPDAADVEQNCHAEYLPVPEDEDVLKISIDENPIGYPYSGYPYHKASMCFPPDKAEGRTSIEHKYVDVSVDSGDELYLRGVSMFGNGDEEKFDEWFWPFERFAGLVYASLEPMKAKTAEDAQKECPLWSPIRDVAAGSFRSEWQNVFEEVGKLTKLVVEARGEKVPVAKEMNWPQVDRDSRYNAVCKYKNNVEVKVVIPGPVPTHLPGGDDRINGIETDQCEMGAFWQIVEYNRLMAIFGEGPQSFSKDVNFVCMRVLESDPDPLLQVALDVQKIKASDRVLFAHDALDPRNVEIVYNPTEEEIENLQANSLITIIISFNPPNPSNSLIDKSIK